MDTVRRTIELDSATDARLRELAAEQDKEISAILAEAVVLLDSVVDIGGPDLEEDRRRLREFKRSRAGGPAACGQSLDRQLEHG